MAINTIKTLTLDLDGTSVEAQLTRAALIDEPDTEELTTFSGTETSAIPNFNLELAGFQDWSAAESVFQLIADAYEDDAEIAFVLEVGTKTRTGTAKATAAPPFGGDAGAALTGDLVLDVIGVPTSGTVTP